MKVNLALLSKIARGTHPGKLLFLTKEVFKYCLMMQIDVELSRWYEVFNKIESISKYKGMWLIKKVLNVLGINHNDITKNDLIELSKSLREYSRQFNMLLELQDIFDPEYSYDIIQYLDKFLWPCILKGYKEAFEDVYLENNIESIEEIEIKIEFIVTLDSLPVGFVDESAKPEFNEGLIHEAIEIWLALNRICAEIDEDYKLESDSFTFSITAY